MLNLINRLINFFNQPCNDYLIEERYYKRLQDMKDSPDKYTHINKGCSNNGKIPPVSLF